jgi:hypothetical protein
MEPEIAYVLGIHSTMTVWRPGENRDRASVRKGNITPKRLSF